MILPLKLIKTDNKKRANIEFEIVRSNFTQPGASPAKKKTGLMMPEGKKKVEQESK